MALNCGASEKFIFFLVLSGIMVLASACSQNYYYDDFDSRFAWHEDVRFTTPAFLPEEGYSFIVIADVHIGDEKDALRFAQIQSKLEQEDRFIVIVGDITGDGTREQIQLFLAAAAHIGIPCYPVIGNHDIYTDRGKPWKELLGSTVYRIDSPGTSLFILDNANAAFGYEQLEWFENGLKTAEKNTFVFSHENFFIETSLPDYDQITDIRERARVMALLKNRCTAMFMGHLHKRIIKQFGGVQYIVMENYGTIGGTMAFCRVRVSTDGVALSFHTK